MFNSVTLMIMIIMAFSFFRVLNRPLRVLVLTARASFLTPSRVRSVLSSGAEEIAEGVRVVVTFGVKVLAVALFVLVFIVEQHFHIRIEVIHYRVHLAQQVVGICCFVFNDRALVPGSDH